MQRKSREEGTRIRAGSQEGRGITGPAHTPHPFPSPLGLAAISGGNLRYCENPSIPCPGWETVQEKEVAASTRDLGEVGALAVTLISLRLSLNAPVFGCICA